MDANAAGPKLNAPRSTKFVLGACAAATCALWMGAGAAAASPDVTGKTYADAKAALAKAGLTPVLSTVFGGKLSHDDCKVINQHDQPAGSNASWPASATANGIFVGGSGGASQYNGTTVFGPSGASKVLLALSCYGAKDAGPGQVTGSGDINTAKPNNQ